MLTETLIQGCRSTSDAGYLRGVTHGLEIAWLLLENHGIAGKFKADMVSACNIAMEYRTDHQHHPALMDELLAELRHRKRSQQQSKQDPETLI